MRPADIVRRLCPNAKPSYIAAFEAGDDLFRAHGVTTPLRVAHFLAQCLHETGGLKIEWESGNYTAERLLQVFGVGHHSAAVTPAEAATLAHNGPAIFERVYGLGNPGKARELGNTQPGDGWRYRGGGIMQTTGRGNYRRMGETCGVDFEGHPELVLSAEHALKPALAEWSEGNLNAAADADDIRAITRRINGGYNGLDDRIAWLARIKPLAKLDGSGAPPAAPALPPRGTAWVQASLNTLGQTPPLAVDGALGPMTRLAIRQFQAAHGLEVDGIAGTQTVAAISAALNATAAVSGKTKTMIAGGAAVAVTTGGAVASQGGGDALAIILVFAGLALVLAAIGFALWRISRK